MNIVYCPFCDKKFEVQEKLRLHVIEHHHITEKKYYEVWKALKLKQSMNEIFIDMKDVIREFAEKLETVEKKVVNNFFENEVAPGSEDIKLREPDWRSQ